MEDYKYYKDWYDRYMKKWWRLINKKEQNHKVKYLIQEMRYFMWMLEHRMVLHKHYDDAKSHPSYPKCLDFKNYKKKIENL